MNVISRIPQLVQSRIRRRVIVFGCFLAIIAVAYIAYSAIRMNSTTTTSLNTSTTQTSAQGLFRGSWVSQLDPININQIHVWTLHLETADGQPLENAKITVDGGMPEHGHGLPTQPQVTQYLGRGDYRVEGMKFQMIGWWVVNFHITANGKSDTLQFNLILK